jgi:lipopolysaccharide exporter
MMLRFSLVIFGFGTYFMLAHFYFSNEQMGHWSIYMSIITTIEITKQGLLRNALIKFLHSSEYAHKKHAIQSASIIISVIFTALICLVITAFAHKASLAFNSPPLQNLLYISVLYMLILIPFNHCEIVLQGNFEYKHNFYGYFIRQGLFFSYIIFCAFFFKQGLNFIYLVLVQVLGIALATIYLYTKTKPFLYNKFVYDKNIVFELLNFGKYVFGTTLFGNISRSADQLITANLLSPVSVSYYNATNRVSTLMDFPTTAAADILFPKNAQAAGNLEGLPKVKYYFERMVGTLTAIIIPMALFIFFFPKFVILVIAGKNYLPSVPILQVMASYAVIRPFVYNFGHTMDSIGKPIVNFIQILAIMIFSCITTYYFIKIFGLMGAAYSIALMHVVSLVAYVIILKKYLDVKWKNIFAYTWQAYMQMYDFIKNFLKKKKVVNIEG